MVLSSVDDIGISVSVAASFSLESAGIAMSAAANSISFVADNEIVVAGGGGGGGTATGG